MFQTRQVSDSGKVRPDSPERTIPDPYLEKFDACVAIAHAARAQYLREMIIRFWKRILWFSRSRSGPASKATSWGYTGR